MVIASPRLGLLFRGGAHLLIFFVTWITTRRCMHYYTEIASLTCSPSVPYLPDSRNRQTYRTISSEPKYLYLPAPPLPEDLVVDRTRAALYDPTLASENLQSQSGSEEVALNKRRWESREIRFYSSLELGRSGERESRNNE